MKNLKRKMIRLSSRVVSIILVTVLMMETGLGSGSIVLADPMIEETNEFVQEDIQDIENDKPSEQEVVDITKEPQILFEVESLREQNEKHYRLSDGTMMASEYAMDVHYEDENGDWTEIDNRFVYEPATETDAMEGYATSDGLVEFKFAPDTSGEMVRAADGEHSVSFNLITEESAVEEMQTSEEVQVSAPVLEDLEVNVSLDETMEAESTEIIEIEETELENEDMEKPETSASSVPITFIKGEILNADAIPVTMETLTTGTISINASADVMSESANAKEGDDIWTGDWEDASEGESLTEQAAVENAVTSVGYENVLPGTSLQYIASGSSLKEYILVEARQDSYRYAFYMNLENLIPQMQEDNSILLKDSKTDEVIYEIPSAFMTDAAGEYSDAVTMSIEEKSDEIYILVIEADEEWINSSERTFPVQIDPSLNKDLSTQTSTGGDTLRGSYVMDGDGKQNTPNVNYGNMFVGYDSSGDGNYITYIQARNLPELPDNSVICKAIFHIYFSAFSRDPITEFNVIMKEMIDSSWSTNYTWNNKPNTGNTILEHQKLTFAGRSDYTHWDITELVKNYYQYDQNIMGFSLQAYEDMPSGSRAKATLRLTNTVNTPVLQILYRDTKGVEGYYTYQTHSIGNAGTAYIGDYSGQLILVKPAVSYSSTILPYSLNLVYNSAFSDKHFSSENDLNTANYSSMKIATGWKLSAQETIVEKQITNLDGTSTYLVYNDNDGTDHYFHPQKNSTTVYEDEDGLDLTITKDNQFYYLTDENGNKKTFAYGYLYKIEDESGNAIHIMYNNCTDPSNNIVNSTGGNRITSVISKPKDTAAETIFTLYYNVIRQIILCLIHHIKIGCF